MSLLAPGPEFPADTEMTVKRSRGQNDVVLSVPGSVFLTNAFQRERGSFPCFFPLERRSIGRESAPPSLTEFELLLSVCMLLTTDHCRSMVRIFFFGSKSVWKLLSK